MRTEINRLVLVETEDLEAEAIGASGGGGNTAYDHDPADASVIDATLAAAPTVSTPPFTASSFTVVVEIAAIDIEISSDGGANYGDFYYLPVGTWSFDFAATDVRVRRHDDAIAATYTIGFFA